MSFSAYSNIFYNRNQVTKSKTILLLTTTLKGILGIDLWLKKNNLTIHSYFIYFEPNPILITYFYKFSPLINALFTSLSILFGIGGEYMG
jgi:hypothetical protein